MARKKTAFEKATIKMLDDLLKAQTAYNKAYIYNASGTQEAARQVLETKRAELTGVIHKLHSYRRKYTKLRQFIREHA